METSQRRQKQALDAALPRPSSSYISCRRSIRRRTSWAWTLLAVGLVCKRMLPSPSVINRQDIRNAWFLQGW